MLGSRAARSTLAAGILPVSLSVFALQLLPELFHRAPCLTHFRALALLLHALASAFESLTGFRALLGACLGELVGQRIGGIGRRIHVPLGQRLGEIVERG